MSPEDPDLLPRYGALAGLLRAYQSRSSLAEIPRGLRLLRSKIFTLRSARTRALLA
jgi:hypothetical protein